MTSKASLYGVPRPRPTNKEITSSTNLAFTAHLSSLLASSPSTTSTSTTARPRPSKTKEDIFKTHNRGAKKRALADLDPTGNAAEQIHQTDIGGLEEGDLKRAKRKMEEKSRLYAAMKRGDYVPDTRRGGINAEDHSLVDFDRKWAEGGGNEDGNDSSSSSSDSDSSPSLTDHEDEFGRLRRVTKREKARLQRQSAASAHAAAQLESFAARPAAPSTVLKGDLIQSAAFNPSVTIAEQMASLASKRDRSLTPPPETHYDASTEIRSKGVGFYHFSREEGRRQEEMEALERERGETERAKREVERRREEKARGLEERKRVVQRMREEKLADRFLSEIG